MGAPNIQIAGFDQVGITPPEGRSDPTGHLTDILSLVEGKHQFRFGGEVRQGRVDEFYHRRSLGSFSFDGTQGPWAADTAVSSNVLALADYLAGYVSTSDIAVGDPERFVRVNSFDFFAQDSWQVTRNLNVNLGLRYDYMGPLYSTNQDLAVFIPGEGLKIQGNGINRIFPPDWNNFGPRLGFAYQPTSKNDLVVRGGFGVFYDQINMNPFLDYRGNGADGLQDNPIGPKPVDNYSLSNYTWQANQYIFPGSTSCPTLSGCGGSLYNVYSVNQDFRTPYYFNYSLNVEKAFGNAVVWQVGYVGSLGRKSSVMLNLNQNGGYNGEYPNVGSIYQLNSMGNSNYNAMQSTLKIRSWHGVTSAVSVHLGARIGRCHRVPRRDSTGQLQPGAGIWKQRFRHTPELHHFSDLRHSRIRAWSEVALARLAVEQLVLVPQRTAFQFRRRDATPGPEHHWQSVRRR